MSSLFRFSFRQPLRFYLLKSKNQNHRIFANGICVQPIIRRSWRKLLICGSFSTFAIGSVVYCSSKNENLADFVPVIDRQLKPSVLRFFIAAAINDANEIKRLIWKGMDPNVRHPLGWTALHVAAYNGNIDAVKVLLENGADIDAVDLFVHSDHPSMHVRLKRENISYGKSDGNSVGFRFVDVDYSREMSFPSTKHGWWQQWRIFFIRTFRGMTALHYAVLMRNLEMARLLIAHGANPMVENEAGYFAEDYASDDVTKLLLTSYVAQMKLDHKRRPSLDQHFLILKALFILLRSISRVVNRSRRYAGVDDEDIWTKRVMQLCYLFSVVVFTLAFTKAD